MAVASPWLLLLTAALLLATINDVHSFGVGMKGTTCNLDPSVGEVNDPCGSLYDGICGGKHCKCPADMHEDQNLKRCVPGAAVKNVPPKQAGGGDDLFDLPFDYVPPGERNGGGSSGGGGGAPTPAVQPPPQPPPQRPPQPPQPQPPAQPQPQPQPGYNPNQPGGYNPNQPGVKPTDPGGYNPNQPGYKGKKKGNNDDGLEEEVGGGVGGVLGLGLIVGLIYFCCCRGEKGKQNRQRFQGLPFANNSNNQNMPMQQGGGGGLEGQIVQQDPSFASQHSYVPPGGGEQQAQYPGGYAPVPQQPAPGYAPQPQPGYAPPPQPGYAPGYAPPPQPGYAMPPQGYPGAQPPPAYTQQYQPQAPM